jgi:hypothetical protein
MFIGKLAAAALAAAFAFVGVAPTAGAATFSQTLPAGCTAPTLSGATLSCNGSPVFTIVDYPCESQLMLGLQDGVYSVSCATPNHTGLYWVPAESGQGYTLTHQANSIFLLAYVYGSDRTPQWLSMLAKLDDTGSYVGEVLMNTGQPGNPFPHYVSTGSLTPNADGTIQLTIGSTTKTLRRFDFADGTPLPTCQFGATPASIATGLWWNPSQAGAGFGIHDQGGRLFVTWYSYDAAGNPRWGSAFMNAAGANTYAGALYSTTGPTFSSASFDAAAVVATSIGTAALSIADSTHATFSVGTTDIPLTRFTFATPGTACQ